MRILLTSTPSKNLFWCLAFKNNHASKLPEANSSIGSEVMDAQRLLPGALVYSLVKLQGFKLS